VRILIGCDLFLQVRCDFGELGEGGFEVVYDVGGDDSGGGKVRAFFQGVVFQPEDVEA
jgi:hypothetical protein